MYGAMMIAGLDLAANPRRCSGYASMDLNERAISNVKCLYDDENILSEMLKDKVKLVAIDAPLSPEPTFRDVDRRAIRGGYRVLPPTLGAMRMLVARAWKLYEALSIKGVKVIETHPKSALKASGEESVEALLSKMGIRLDADNSVLLVKDLRDAIISLVVAYCYQSRTRLMEIKGKDGVIYLIGAIP
jgi:predicted nuclease with RNAse H fold